MEKLAEKYSASITHSSREKNDSKRELVNNARPGNAFVFDTLHIVDQLFQNWEILFGGGLVGFLKFGKDIILQWLKNSGLREVEVKKGDISIRIKGSNDIEKAIKYLEEKDKD